jgi:hypothetical protein
VATFDVVGGELVPRAEHPERIGGFHGTVRVSLEAVTAVRREFERLVATVDGAPAIAATIAAHAPRLGGGPPPPGATRWRSPQ